MRNPDFKHTVVEFAPSLVIHYDCDPGNSLAIRKIISGHSNINFCASHEQWLAVDENYPSAIVVASLPVNQITI